MFNLIQNASWIGLCMGHSVASIYIQQLLNDYNYSSNIKVYFGKKVYFDIFRWIQVYSGVFWYIPVFSVFRYI